MIRLYRRKDGDLAVNSEADGGGAGAARIFAFENAQPPTPGDDVLIGTSDNDEIHGLEGNDEIYGLAGTDYLTGDAGNDRIEGGDHFDQIYGGTGDDLLYGGEGDDFLKDDSGNDQLYGEGGKDDIFAFRFDPDPVGTVLLDGGADDDVITFFSSRHLDVVTLTGGGGDDHISAGRGLTVTIDAGSGDDRVALNFLGADHRITLGSGSDLLVLLSRQEPLVRAGEIVVTDFETGDLGDRLELLPHLPSVLQGWSADTNPFATGHLRLIQNGVHAVLQMDENGAAGGMNFADLVRFENRNVAAFTQFNLGGYPANGGPPTQTTFVGTAARDVIWGSFGGDLIQGLGGADELHGSAGNDRLEGGDDPDFLDGQLGNDLLFGGAGNDELLDDFGGDDQLFGEGGDDRLLVLRNQPAATSTLLLDGGADNDVLSFSAAFGFAGTALLLGGQGNDDLYATGGRFVTLNGGAGDDYVQLNFAEGPYTITLGQGYDQLVLGGQQSAPGFSVTVTDFAPGELGPETDVLFLREYAQTRIPGWNGVSNLFETGHLRLVQSGADTLLRIDLDGFAGAGGATDLVRFQNVAAVALTQYNLNGFDSGTFDLVGTGNADTLIGSWGANNIDGLGGNDIIDGRAGADRLTGGGGNDTYYVDDAGDAVIELAGGGHDIVYALSNYTLAAGSHVEILSSFSIANQGNLNLTGNERDNVIAGTYGANVLYGGGGADVLIGFRGDDTYIVDGNDVVHDEEAIGGHDIVYALSDYTLGAGQHIEVLSSFSIAGQSALNLTGNEFANVIAGNYGANTLYGGGGQDVLIGFAGNDTYLVDADDVVFENAGEGSDTVYALSNYTLTAGSHVEVLSSFSIAGQGNLNLTGNELANVIAGTYGANVLSGGGGQDVLIGFLGDDTYIVDGNDVVYENASEGSDTVYALTDYVLAAGTHVEILSSFSIGGQGALNLTGNEFGNVLAGTTSANMLDGKGGNDYLVGFGGGDTFSFTTALNGATNVDTIQGFQAGTDKIVLDHVVFGGLVPGALPAGAFRTGGGAADTDDRVIYNSATGQLFFDIDGSGGGAAVQFAILDAGLALTASDFTVI